MTDSDTKDDFSAWRLVAAGLHMRAGKTEADKLVLLADVVRWLMSEGGEALPRAEAVESLCVALEQASPEPELFRARRGTWASLLQDGDALFRADLFDDPLMNGFPNEVRDKYLCPSAIGTAVKHIKARWSELPLVRWSDKRKIEYYALDDDGLLGFGLAVRASVAHELWGWGGAVVTDAVPGDSATVPTGAVLSSVPSVSPEPAHLDPVAIDLDGRVIWKNEAPEWTGDALIARRKRLKGRNKTKQLSKLTGLPDREITRRERAYRDEVKGIK